MKKSLLAFSAFVLLASGAFSVASANTSTCITNFATVTITPNKLFITYQEDGVTHHDETGETTHKTIKLNSLYNKSFLQAFLDERTENFLTPAEVNRVYSMQSTSGELKLGQGDIAIFKLLDKNKKTLFSFVGTGGGYLARCQ